jgi:hypothetical protein
MAATTDRHHEQEWHRDPRRDKGPQNFQSDSGWDTRRGGKGWDEPHVWDDTSYEKDHPKVEDRSWEPAPSWQPSGRREFDQNNRNGQRNNYASRNSKGGKRGAFVNKQKRDWRNDDGNLNKYVAFFLFFSAVFKFLQLDKKGQSRYARQGSQDTERETPSIGLSFSFPVAY